MQSAISLQFVHKIFSVRLNTFEKNTKICWMHLIIHFYFRSIHFINKAIITVQRQYNKDLQYIVCICLNI